LLNTPRTTTVQFKCGPSDALVSVVEDHTCHYRAVVTTPHLCKHPAFVHRRPATRTLTCEPKPHPELS
jgi:protein OS-9